MAQRRSAGTALDYVRGLAPEVKANCWGLAEAAGHERPYRMQALLGSYRWDWKDLRAELPALARAWLPCDPGDLIGVRVRPPMTDGVRPDVTAGMGGVPAFSV